MPSLNHAASRLRDDWSQAEQAWDEACAGWQDQTRAEFERECWHTIDAERRVYEMALQELMTVLAQARRAVN